MQNVLLEKEELVKLIIPVQNVKQGDIVKIMLVVKIIHAHLVNIVMNLTAHYAQPVKLKVAIVTGKAKHLAVKIVNLVITAQLAVHQVQKNVIMDFTVHRVLALSVSKSNAMLDFIV
jgi:hypothetical protein